MSVTAIRANFLHCLRDPGLDGGDAGAVEHIRDGVLLVRPDKIIAWRSQSLPANPEAALTEALTSVLSRKK